MPIVNKQVRFLTSQYIGTFTSTYTKGYALNWVLTEVFSKDEMGFINGGGDVTANKTIINADGSTTIITTTIKDDGTVIIDKVTIKP